MRIDIITIFPEICDFYFQQSLLKKAQQAGLLKLKAHNLRDFTNDKHRAVDDKPFGGGRGMVMKIEPIARAVKEIEKEFYPLRGKSKASSKKSRIVLFSPRGKEFNQKMATKWAKSDQLILICGRYEGVDERVARNLADEIVSIGDYVLMGGELPALIVAETVARLLPGVVGHSEDLIGERITKSKGFLEYPQFTRPEIFCVDKKGKACPPDSSSKQRCWRVPKVLLSGNHKEIDAWRQKNSKVIE
ncbi:MAG: tRNA (guanosine(37)-N1)-methyltransferase TrmD [Candidatus Pacebacteria bacterium]|nr:tRNA (guanosine(37)-N1)-methyltransferase TrmD [Candidatus Paceibacterota bacterium]